MEKRGAEIAANGQRGQRKRGRERRERSGYGEEGRKRNGTAVTSRKINIPWEGGCTGCLALGDASARRSEKTMDGVGDGGVGGGGGARADRMESR